MKIGELAKLTDVLVETIRYYEQQELLMAPARTLGNYRVYGPEHVERLQFILHCRSLDITIDEIRTLIKFQDAPEANCGKVDQLLDIQLEKVNQKIERLLGLQAHLTALRGLCHAQSAVKDCPIMHKLACCDVPDCTSVKSTPALG